MKKFVMYSAFSLFALQAFSQKGKHNLQLIAEAGIPEKMYNVGYGGYLKGLFGIQESAQLTLTTGISRFHSTTTSDEAAVSIRVVPLLVGYKQHISRFYIEPQAGYGELGGKLTMSGDYARHSIGGVVWAVGAGYSIKRIDLGVRYQSFHGAEGTAAGLWHSKDFRFVGIQAAFSLL